MLSSSFHPVLSSNASITLAAAEADSNQIFSLLVDELFLCTELRQAKKRCDFPERQFAHRWRWMLRKWCIGLIWFMLQVGVAEGAEDLSLVPGMRMRILFRPASLRAMILKEVERSLSSIMLLAGQRDCLSTTNFLRTWEGGREAQHWPCLTYFVEIFLHLNNPEIVSEEHAERQALLRLLQLAFFAMKSLN